MTPAQMASLKTEITNDSALSSQPNNGDGNFAIAVALNLLTSPDFWVWRSFVPDAEIYEATSTDGTTWSWTTYIARSQGERDAWRQMVNMKGGVNASLANTRQGIADIFSGAGGATQRTHLLTLGRRKATRIEKLLATGTGSTASPASLGFEGLVSGSDVGNARNLP